MEPRSLLLFVQVLHNPGFRGNKLGGRDSELHELSKGNRVTTVIGIVSFRKTRRYTRPNLLPEERILILRVLESILLECLVADQGIIGAGIGLIWDTLR